MHSLFYFPYSWVGPLRTETSPPLANILCKGQLINILGLAGLTVYMASQFCQKQPETTDKEVNMAVFQSSFIYGHKLKSHVICMCHKIVFFPLFSTI